MATRRKQPRPQRLPEPGDPSYAEDGTSAVDSHFCGYCSTQFFNLTRFLQHKQCCSMQPCKARVSENQLDQNLSEVTPEVENENALNLCKKPYPETSFETEQPVVDDVQEVDKFEKALESLQQQQIMQLQLIEQICKVLPSEQGLNDLSLPSSLLSPPNSNETSTVSNGNHAGPAEHAEDVNCEMCGLLFASEPRLLWHLSQEHTEGKPYSCQLCDINFATRDDFYAHNAIMHRINRRLIAGRPASCGPQITVFSEKDFGRRSVFSESAEIYWIVETEAENRALNCTPYSDVSCNDDMQKETEEISPLDLSCAKMTVFSPSSLHAADVITPVSTESEPAPLHVPTYTPHIMETSFAAPMRSFEPPRLPQNDKDDDWESMMEISQTDENAKIRQLVGDKPIAPPADPNQCLICRRILSCKSALQMHYRTHTGERPFKCKLCLRAFTTKGNLKTHMGVHRSKYPFRVSHQCPICQKRFLNTVLLQQHIRMHTTQLASAHFVKEEPSKQDLKQVVPQNLSLESKPPKLTLELYPNYTVTAPTSTPESDEFSAAMYCSTSSEQPSQVFSLQQQSPFTPGPLPTHQSMFPAAELKTTCNVCFKTFACNSALDIHYRSHTKERPFKCKVCYRGFSTKGNMKQHYLTHKIRDNMQEDGRSEPSSIRTSSSPTEEIEEGSIATDSFNGDMEEIIKDNQPITNGTLPTTSQMGPSPLESIQKMWAQAEPPAPRQAPVLSKHQCSVCYKHFSSSSALQIHMRTHTGDKPFKCSVCDRAFTTKGNLKVHMGTHMWQNPSRRGRRMFDFPIGQSSFGMVDSTGMPSMNGMVPHDMQNNTSNTAVQYPNSMEGGQMMAFSTAGSFLNATHNPYLNSMPHTPFMGPYQPPLPLRGPIPMMQPQLMQSHAPNLLNSQSGQNFAVSPSVGPAKLLNNHSMETMLWIWRNVCSVCQKVCSSPAELEEHLKLHLNNAATEDQSNVS